MKIEPTSHRETLILGMNMLSKVTDSLISFDELARSNRLHPSDIEQLTNALEDFKLVLELIDELMTFYRPNEHAFRYQDNEFEYWPERVHRDFQIILEAVETWNWKLLSRVLNHSMSINIEAYSHFIKTFLTLLPPQASALG